MKLTVLTNNIRLQVQCKNYKIIKIDVMPTSKVPRSIRFPNKKNKKNELMCNLCGWVEHHKTISYLVKKKKNTFKIYCLKNYKVSNLYVYISIRLYNSCYHIFYLINYFKLKNI